MGIKEEHLALLKEDVEAWNRWRSENRHFRVDLVGADLSGARLHNADLSGVDLEGANLSEADLGGANLRGQWLRGANLRGASLEVANLNGADLRETVLSGAYLSNADLRRAILAGTDLSNADLYEASLISASLDDVDLSNANLRGADLRRANLIRTNLRGANLLRADFSRAVLNNTDFSEAILGDNIFANTELTKAKGLDTCRYIGPSSVDQRTLELSSDVPLNFLRGCGLPEALIDYLPSILNKAIHFYSCFISYSSKDQEFAERLHADLQNAGVRCWFAPHDLPIGVKTWDGIDQAIRTRDKVLLILSERAIASNWVEDEVTTAFAEERRRDELVLLPVRLDDAVMDSKEPWAGKLRDNRNIGDFTRWTEHDTYKATFERVLRDLRAES